MPISAHFSLMKNFIFNRNCNFLIIKTIFYLKCHRRLTTTMQMIYIQLTIYFPINATYTQECSTVHLLQKKSDYHYSRVKFQKRMNKVDDEPFFYILLRSLNKAQTQNPGINYIPIFRIRH